MTKRNIEKILGICFLLLFMSACSDGDKEMPNPNGKPSLIFNMGASSRAIIDNTQVYLFDNGTWNFKKKVIGVNCETDKLSMTVDAGTWNIGLVTANADISTDIISPVRDQNREDCKLWETKPVSGALPSMPELRTASLASQVVLPNQMNTASETARLDRNVALVKVIIEDANGLVTTGGTHNFELTKVPTTLSWTGGLYPNKDNPTQSAVPMKGKFTVENHPTEAGRQISDTLMFIVPAHKGSDYLNPSPADTTTHYLNLNVDFECDGTGRFKKENVVIPRTPKVNTILLVRLYVGGKLEVTSEILDWKDVDLEGDFSQTLLHVDRASVGLAHKDTIYVNTTADNFTVSSDAAASWLSVQRIGTTNGVEITANVNTYVDNQPRDSYIEIKANNVTKKIPVTQRPDRGTISVDNKRLVFCPINHEQRSVQVNSIGGDWEFVNANVYKATPNKQGGTTGTVTPVTFTRGFTTNVDNFDRYYGDTIIVVKNKMTLDTDTVSLVNCYIHMDDNTINASAPTGNATIATTVSNDIMVYGGNKDLIITKHSDWIHSNISWDSVGQTLTFVTDREPEDEARTGFMTFFHTECSDYIITADVYQDIIVLIDPFDYFVVSFTWSAGSDVDIAVEFAGNNLSGNGSNNTTYDKIPVGWSMNTINPGKGVTGTGGGSTTGRVSFDYKGKTLLTWGGDAMSREGETAFFDALVFEKDDDSPRKINLEIYSHWFSGTKGDPMVLNMVAYKGGTMERGTNNTGEFNKFNFYNKNGEYALEPLSYKVKIATSGSGQYSKYDTGGYTHVATLVYDRVKHTASVKVHAAIDHSRGGITTSTIVFDDSYREIIGYDRDKPIYK